MSRRLVVALVTLAALTVAGCTGVPTSSGPQVVKTLGLGEAPPTTVEAPPNGASPNAIVRGFLDATAASPDRLDAARAYLDDDAAKTWSSTGATIVAQTPFNVGELGPDNTVALTYRPVATLTAGGVYTPNLGGQGNRTATYTVTKNSAGQWRISSPVPPGLFLRQDDFSGPFTARPLYFLDPSGTHLVPDVRWSPLTDVSLASFLLAQLLAGPRAELQNAVSPFVPAPAGNQRPSVTAGSPLVVQVPGAAALEGNAVRGLAAQLAYTLLPLGFRGLKLVDGTDTVDVPGVGDTFDRNDFPEFGAPTGDPTLTYIRGGAVVDADGDPLPGRLGSGTYDLDTAVFDDTDGRSRVAATSPVGTNGLRRLLVGDTGELTAVGLRPARLTAPAWAPVGTASDTDEVWVASGPTIYRFLPGVVGARPTPVPLSGSSAGVPGDVTAIAFSPEGTRLALVVSGSDGSSVLFVGAVIRTGADVSLGPLTQITPGGLVVSDVGWRTETTLAGIGGPPSASAGLYFDVFADGAVLATVTPDGLPDRPRSLAVSARTQNQWATVGSGGNASVWTRSSYGGAQWTSPDRGAARPGSAPSFSI
ncbi:GerMN domain-containing protein [Jatrophihabitans sp. YIM 134969]